jgi:ribosomal protein S18 acetylase RimI-like enzyme
MDGHACASGETGAILPAMITLRVASASDQDILGRFGGALMRQHHAADPRRFIQVDHPEAGYGRFLVSQLANPNSRVMVAEHAGAVVGYVYADVESTSWMDLRGPCGVIHDVYVDEGARHLGAGRALVGAAIDWIRSKGRTQVVLFTKTRNEHARHLFTALGFRPTMIEMTLDQDPRGSSGHA